MESNCGKCEICEACTPKLRPFTVGTHTIRRSGRTCCTALACGRCLEKVELIHKLMIHSTFLAMLPLAVLGGMAFFAESSIPDWLRYGGTALTLASMSSLALLWIARWWHFSGTAAARIALQERSKPGMCRTLFLIPQAAGSYQAMEALCASPAAASVPRFHASRS